MLPTTCEVIGSYAVALRAEQRARRCLRFLDRPDLLPALARELQASSAGCVGWTPVEHPGWLLLEVDNEPGREVSAPVLASLNLASCSGSPVRVNCWEPLPLKPAFRISASGRSRRWLQRR